MYGTANMTPLYPKSTDKKGSNTMSDSTPTHDPVAEFLAKGGTIETVPSGKRAMSEREIYLRTDAPDEVVDDYTERSMRAAENQDGLEQHHPYFSH